jgi:hypothetical protein
MFFISDDTIINIARIPGESNKEFFKKGYYVASKGVTSDSELKMEMTKYYNQSGKSK